MKKNIKAIIAALSASIMCAVPVAASFANTAAVTSITASATDPWDTWSSTPDVIVNASHASFLGNDGVIANSLVYRISGTGSNRAAKFEGRYNPVADLNLPDKIRVDGVVYPVTEILNGACEGQGSVKSLNAGKYLEKIGDRAFKNSGIKTLVCRARKIDIGFDAFYNGYLRTVELPGDVTIKDRAFMWNNFLRTVTITCNDSSNYNKPVSLGHNAFKYCTALESFTTDNRRWTELYHDTFANTPDTTWFQGFHFVYLD